MGRWGVWGVWEVWVPTRAPLPGGECGVRGRKRHLETKIRVHSFRCATPVAQLNVFLTGLTQIDLYSAFQVDEPHLHK
ncbi:MAG: hypothetical protein F6K23_16250 [Okeania sp. SIO2C9]|uniref:hypothetical protein n=1 Tax=Okeania sp. SIO2C9 TaxID=2607791 RepID=UPI0013C200BA|nr:hypothetical protein [Okeania sp. SIO2C9]NEQ74446.1 hypothetical protein [Okeania sp. SIO2C9]